MLDLEYLMVLISGVQVFNTVYTVTQVNNDLPACCLRLPGTSDITTPSRSKLTRRAHAELDTVILCGSRGFVPPRPILLSRLS